MRLLTSSSTNRWKAAEIQLHSSTQARVLTHLKCFVLRERGYSQELCSLGQNFSMYCPSQSLHLFLLPGLPFQPVFPSLQSGFIVMLAQVELASFPGIWRGPSPGLVQGQEAAGSAGTCPPALACWGQGVEAGGAWELQIVMEKELVLQASCLGVLLCFMVFRKCFAVEEQFL